MVNFIGSKLARIRIRNPGSTKALRLCPPQFFQPILAQKVLVVYFYGYDFKVLNLFY